jgi:hypothetical protein
VAQGAIQILLRDSCRISDCGVQCDGSFHETKSPVPLSRVVWHRTDLPSGIGRAHIQIRLSALWKRILYLVENRSQKRSEVLLR